MDQKAYELTTSLNVDADGRDEMEAVGAGFLRALQSALVSFPKVTAYYVRLDGNDLSLGLRFVGVEPNKIEDMADAVLQDALRELEQGDGSGHDIVREESTLVPA